MLFQVLCIFIPDVDSRALFSYCQTVLKATVPTLGKERQRWLCGSQHKRNGEFRVLWVSMQSLLNSCKKYWCSKLVIYFLSSQYDFRADKRVFSLWYFDDKSQVPMVIVQGLLHANNFLFVASYQNVVRLSLYQFIRLPLLYSACQRVENIP